MLVVLLLADVLCCSFTELGGGSAAVFACCCFTWLGICNPPSSVGASFVAVADVIVYAVASVVITVEGFLYMYQLGWGLLAPPRFPENGARYVSERDSQYPNHRTREKEMPQNDCSVELHWPTSRHREPQFTTGCCC